MMRLSNESKAPDVLFEKMIRVGFMFSKEFSLSVVCSYFPKQCLQAQKSQQNWPNKKKLYILVNLTYLEKSSKYYNGEFYF